MSGLLPGWDPVVAREEQAREGAERTRLFVPPIDESVLSDGVYRAGSSGEAAELLRVFRSLDLRAVAVELVCARRPELELGGARSWFDVRTTQPVFVAFAAITGTVHIVRAVLDARIPAVVEALDEILRLRTCWAAHDWKPLLHGLWALGLEPDQQHIHDTYLAAACVNLGRFHKREVARGARGERERIQTERDARVESLDLLSLSGQCQHYGLPPPPSSAGDPPEVLCGRTAPLLVAGALTVACIYLRQRADPDLLGLDHHLHTVEFPFAIANARIEWNGVHVGERERRKLRDAAVRATSYWSRRLAEQGISPPGSAAAFRRFLSRQGIARPFVRDGHVSLEDDVLEANEALHPSIRAFRLHRRYQRLAGEPWLSGAMTGADGRIHPVHRQLGAATGRSTCSSPNLVGIGRVLRPVVTAPPGRALFELDYAQIEVGIAAAEHGDRDLVLAFNSGDVYAAMAQGFYAHELTPAERAITPVAFKRARPELRERMKTFVLAVLYGMQARGVAVRFGVSIQAARREHERFLDLFPVLKNRLSESAAFGLARGSATVVTGLRRHIGVHGRHDRWTENYMRNTPIQGAAAVVFKRAVARLDLLLRGTGSMIVLPLHDAVLIECDLRELNAVALRAAQVMRDAVREIYPVLEPRVEINRSAPWCWNKDGRADSLERFLADPSFRLDGAREVGAPPVEERGILAAQFAGWEFGPRQEGAPEGEVAADGWEEHRA